MLTKLNKQISIADSLIKSFEFSKRVELEQAEFIVKELREQKRIEKSPFVDALNNLEEEKQKFLIDRAKFLIDNQFIKYNGGIDWNHEFFRDNIDVYDDIEVYPNDISFQQNQPYRGEDELVELFIPRKFFERTEQELLENREKELREEEEKRTIEELSKRKKLYEELRQEFE